MRSHWTAVEEAIGGILSATTGVAFGLLTYPVSGGCSVDQPTWTTPTIRWPDAPVGAEPAAIAQALARRPPEIGLSPVVRTLEWISENPDVLWRHEFGPRYVVLLTDGGDTCRCKDSTCLASALENVTGGLYADHAVKTVPIGFRYGNELRLLNLVAQNGGSEFTESLTAATALELGEAFLRVVESTKTCGSE